MRILAQESAPEHIQDVEREERQREAEIVAAVPCLTIVEEMEREQRDMTCFTPTTYIPRVHFFVSLRCDVYVSSLHMMMDRFCGTDRRTFHP